MSAKPKKSAPQSPAFQEAKASPALLLKTALLIGLGAIGFYLGNRPDKPAASQDANPTSTATAFSAPTNAADMTLQLLALPEGLDRRLRLLSLIDHANVAEYPRLLEMMSGDIDNQSAVAEAWAEKDPAGFFAWASRQYYPRASSGGALNSILFKTWAKTDPSAAIAAARKSRHLSGFQGAEWEVLLGAYEKDSKSALPLLAQIKGDCPPGFTFPPGLWKVAPGALIKEVADAKGTVGRFLALGLGEAMTEWSKRSPQEVLKWLQGSPPERWQELLSYAMPGLSGTDPAAVQLLLEKLPDAAARIKAGSELAKAWIEKDPLQALTFAAGKLGAKRETVLEEMAQLLIAKGQAGFLVSAAGQMQPGPEKDLVLKSVANQYLDHDPLLASAWLGSLPADTTRNDLVTRIAARWSETGPDEGAKFFKTTAGDPALAQARDTFTQKWAPHDPAGALNLSQARTLAEQAQGIRTTFSALAHENQFEDVNAILPMLPTPEQREAAMATVLEGFDYGNLDPRALTEWAKMSPELKDRIVEFIKTAPGISSADRADTMALFLEDEARAAGKQVE